jgi:hypothetical protein
MSRRLNKSKTRLIGDAVSRKAARAIQTSGLKLKDFLADLKNQRTRYNRERYGR